MKIQFDEHQEYQLAAIQAVVDLLEGQPVSGAGTAFSFTDGPAGGLAFTETGVANQLQVSDEALLANLRRVQQQNGLRPDEMATSLARLTYPAYTADGQAEQITAPFANFSIEMETGTGKTYVYLRTIYELAQTYGFRKFVIVVPSVAIREGVIKSLQITQAHFQEIYHHEPAEARVYDASRLADLSHFARSNAIQILVLNVDSFAKDANVINQVRERGFRPIEAIRQSRPVVIIDEPQNMETDLRKAAIANLHPLFALRYSATHKNSYNLIYKLDPVKAHDLGLVKQIEVDSVVSRNNDSGGFMSLDGFIRAKKSVSAKMTLMVAGENGGARRQVSARVGDDLYALSNGWEPYKEGFIINEIDAAGGFVAFSGGGQLALGEAAGGLTDAVLREMIDATVEHHFQKEKALAEKGIKVLSIFFIDRVAHYRSYDAAGMPVKGKFAHWFEESFAKWSAQPEFEGLYPYSAADVHDGYFSQDKGRYKDSKEGKSTKADDEAFRLIMQDKERLLDQSTPLRFLFSHSALREGWDNPNVFQICTLNETRSETKKRQEIGRGLRLCVDQSGVRNRERAVNRLTVVANESYEAYSRALQSELEEDCNVRFEGRIQNARRRAQVRLKENWQTDPLFNALWERICLKTSFCVHYDTAALTAACQKALAKMPTIEKPAIVRQKTTQTYQRDAVGNLTGIGGVAERAQVRTVAEEAYEIPDLLAYIQARTELTRDTIGQILLGSGRLGEVFQNPQLFMDTAVRLIRQELARAKMSGIRYEKPAGEVYDATLFETAEAEQYSDQLLPVAKPQKTLYNFVALGARGGPEKAFAEACESREDVLFYVRLPERFQIPTPAGPYHPGWALVKKDATGENQYYFVVDVKDSSTLAGDTRLRESERLQMECARAHFEALGVPYRVISSLSELDMPVA